MKLDWNALTADMIPVAIVSVGKSSETLQLRVHKVLIAIAVDWVKTTDQKSAAERVQTLIETLGTGVRKNALKDYVTAPALFGMRIHESKGTICAGTVKPKDISERMSTLVNTHWWEFTKEPEFKVFALGERVGVLVASATAANAKHDDRNDIPEVILNMLREVEKKSNELSAASA